MLHTAFYLMTIGGGTALVWVLDAGAGLGAYKDFADSGIVAVMLFMLLGYVFKVHMPAERADRTVERTEHTANITAIVGGFDSMIDRVVTSHEEQQKANREVLLMHSDAISKVLSAVAEGER